MDIEQIKNQEEKNKELNLNDNIEKLTEKIINNQLVSTRLGNVESRFLLSYFYKIYLEDNFSKIDNNFDNCDYYMKTNTGLYYKFERDKKLILDWWCENTIEIIKKSTLTSCLCFLNNDLLLWSKIGLKNEFYNWGYLHKLILKNSNNKKILYIGSAVDSIKNGYERGVQNAWKFPVSNFSMYYLKTPQTTLNMEYPDNHIKDTVEKIVNEIIHKYSDFDTAILGCGAYGPPIINYLYNKLSNKNLIYLGSSCYTMFGIYSDGIPIPFNDNDIISEKWIPVSEKLDDRCKNIDQGKYWSK